MSRRSTGAQRAPQTDSNQYHGTHNGNNSHQPQQPHHQQQSQQHHTLVLTQSTSQPSSKHYSDHASVDLALDHIVAQFEQQLPGRAQQLQYDIAQLFAYVDRLPDLAVLVFSPQLMAYEPHDKQWTKSAIYEHLKRQAGQ